MNATPRDPVKFAAGMLKKFPARDKEFGDIALSSPVARARALRQKQNARTIADPGVSIAAPLRGVQAAHCNQRLEYCGRLRALRRPTFLRSTSRASRVT